VDFELWLEFEHWQPAVGPYKDDFANILFTTKDGKQYAANVWTIAYFDAVRATHEVGSDWYLLPPDLIVVELSRHAVERAVGAMIAKHEVPDSWLVPTV
jgi:hypothetical protein